MTDELLQDPSRDRIEDARDRFSAPPVMALVAFVLAVMSLGGFALLSGTTYVMPILNGEPQRVRLVIAILIGAVLALIPVALGRRAASRIVQTDPAWAAVLARSAVLLGLVSLLLRLVVAVLQASQDGPSGLTRL